MQFFTPAVVVRAAEFALLAVRLILGVFPVDSDQFPVAGLSVRGWRGRASITAILACIIGIRGYRGSISNVDRISLLICAVLFADLVCPVLFQRPFPAIRHQVFQRTYGFVLADGGEVIAIEVDVLVGVMLVGIEFAAQRTGSAFAVRFVRVAGLACDVIRVIRGFRHVLRVCAVRPGVFVAVRHFRPVHGV